MNIKTHIANKNNYGSSRQLSKIKFIVIHYTANDGDTDERNGEYFANNVVKASAHYFVDDNSITQTVPDNYNAYHCGASVYKHPQCRNANSLGIEICDTVKNGIVYPTVKTIENTLELTNYLMHKYAIPKENVIRHFDVTGKICPAYWCGSAEKDALWKIEFWNKLGNQHSAPVINTTNSVKIDYAKSFDKSLSGTYKVTASVLNVRCGAGTSKPIIKGIPKGDTVRCYGYYTKSGLTTWLYVQCSDGTVGFVSKKYLKK